jgi:hypothetical protein
MKTMGEILPLPLKHISYQKLFPRNPGSRVGEFVLEFRKIFTPKSFIRVRKI